MRRRQAGLCALALMAASCVAACSPGLPNGVSQDRLNEAVSDAIGDPNTCVLIGKRGSGEVIWRYNTHTTCDRSLPACDAPARRTVDDLLKAAARDGQPRTLSCSSTPDGSRGVGWAAGPVPGHPLVYAAVMEGQRALPGRIMADKVEGALKDAGL